MGARVEYAGYRTFVVRFPPVLLSVRAPGHLSPLLSPVLPTYPLLTAFRWSRRQALPAIAVGHIIISIVMVLNGTIGARLHVGFPVLNRSSFGFWFSYFSVVSRVVLSMFWFGIQTYTGSECVYQVRWL